MKRKKNQRAKIKSKNNLGMLDPTLIFFFYCVNASISEKGETNC